MIDPLKPIFLTDDRRKTQEEAEVIKVVHAELGKLVCKVRFCGAEDLVIIEEESGRTDTDGDLMFFTAENR